jgi:hypothetical protein
MVCRLTAGGKGIRTPGPSATASFVVGPPAGCCERAGGGEVNRAVPIRNASSFARARGLRRKAISPCSIARSVWPAQSLRKPLICARVARIEGERAIDQRDHRIEVFAENRERHCGVGQNARVVLRHLDGPAGKADPFGPERVAIRAVEVCRKMLAALRRKPKGRAVIRVAGNGLLKQPQRPP